MGFLWRVAISAVLALGAASTGLAQGHGPGGHFRPSGPSAKLIESCAARIAMIAATVSCRGGRIYECRPYMVSADPCRHAQRCALTARRC